ncbi:MAG: hypothetical protein JWR60_4165 [Polaromonas sp.]|nr:hypothetical protein [Polaromonas sp.]
MRLIPFSNAAAPASPLWALPVQALVPWMSRIKHTVRHTIGQLAKGEAQAPVHALPYGGRPASNDAVFALPRMHERREMLGVRPGSAALGAAPLRVVREADSSLGAECAGRMVMSGRMADVCAELERMTQRAAAAQAPSLTAKP